MVQQHSAELPHIGEALVTIRAAIDVVTSGAATRVTIHAIGGEQILPAARALARAAHVALEPTWWADGAGLDIAISLRRPARMTEGSVATVERLAPSADLGHAR